MFVLMRLICLFTFWKLIWFSLHYAKTSLCLPKVTTKNEIKKRRVFLSQLPETAADWLIDLLYTHVISYLDILKRIFSFSRIYIIAHNLDTTKHDNRHANLVDAKTSSQTSLEMVGHSHSQVLPDVLPRHHSSYGQVSSVFFRSINVCHLSTFSRVEIFGNFFKTA